MPAFALMIAALVGKLTGWREPALDVTPAPSRRWVTLAQSLVGGLLALVGLGGAAGGGGPRREPAAGAGLAVRRPPAGGRVSRPSWLVAQARQRRAAATAGGVAVAYLRSRRSGSPRSTRCKSARPFALRIAEETAESRAARRPGAWPTTLDNLPEPFAFYSDGV